MQQRYPVDGHAIENPVGKSHESEDMAAPTLSDPWRTFAVLTYLRDSGPKVALERCGNCASDASRVSVAMRRRSAGERAE